MKLILAALLGLTLAAPARAWENPDGPIRTVWLETLGLKSVDGHDGIPWANGKSHVATGALGFRLGFVLDPTVTMSLGYRYDYQRIGDSTQRVGAAEMVVRFYLVRGGR